jgi:hypothetical protein
VSRYANEVGRVGEARERRDGIPEAAGQREARHVQVGEPEPGADNGSPHRHVQVR